MIFQLLPLNPVALKCKSAVIGQGDRGKLLSWWAGKLMSLGEKRDRAHQPSTISSQAEDSSPFVFDTQAAAAYTHCRILTAVHRSLSIFRKN